MEVPLQPCVSPTGKAHEAFEEAYSSMTALPMPPTEATARTVSAAEAAAAPPSHRRCHPQPDGLRVLGLCPFSPVHTHPTPLYRPPSRHCSCCRGGWASGASPGRLPPAALSLLRPAALTAGVFCFPVFWAQIWFIERCQQLERDKLDLVRTMRRRDEDVEKQVRVFSLSSVVPHRLTFSVPRIPGTSPEAGNGSDEESQQ